MPLSFVLSNSPLKGITFTGDLQGRAGTIGVEEDGRQVNKMEHKMVNAQHGIAK